MKVEYLPNFIKDLKSLKSSPSYGRIKTLVFEDILSYDCLDQIPNLKKLKEEDNAYRIRVGDYRIGFFLYEYQRIYTKYILTHAEYDKDKWKNDPYY